MYNTCLRAAYNRNWQVHACTIVCLVVGVVAAHLRACTRACFIPAAVCQHASRNARSHGPIVHSLLHPLSSPGRMNKIQHEFCRRPQFPGEPGVTHKPKAPPAPAPAHTKSWLRPLKRDVAVQTGHGHDESPTTPRNPWLPTPSEWLQLLFDV